MQKYRLYLTRLQKDDLKTSSSGPKHPDINPRDTTEKRTEPIKIQQNEAVSSHRTTNPTIHEVDIKGNNAALQTIKPKKIITGYAAKAGINHPFESTQYSQFNSVLPTQYSWGGGFKEIQFKQENNNNNAPQFQVHNDCFTGLGLPAQQNTSIPSFQPPDPVIGPTWTLKQDPCTEQTSINTINNMELSPFLLQGQQHCSSTNVDHQNKGVTVTEFNDQELLNDALKFDYDYEYPDLWEYPVIGQGLFIV